MMKCLSVLSLLLICLLSVTAQAQHPGARKIAKGDIVMVSIHHRLRAAKVTNTFKNNSNTVEVRELDHASRNGIRTVGANNEPALGMHIVRKSELILTVKSLLVEGREVHPGDVLFIPGRRNRPQGCQKFLKLFENGYGLYHNGFSYRTIHLSSTSFKECPSRPKPKRRGSRFLGRF